MSLEKGGQGGEGFYLEFENFPEFKRISIGDEGGESREDCVNG